MIIKQYIDEIFKIQKEYLVDEKLKNNLNPLVSVFVITYQHEKYIAKCLDSILMQKTDFPFEIVIGEDESTDGTREICIEYANKHPDNIRLFLRDRKQSVINGTSGNKIYLNGWLTLKSCNGKYIALCEGDDYWTDPYKLQKQVDILESHPEYGMVHTDCHVMTGNKLFEHSKSGKPIPSGNVKDELIQKNFLTTATVLIKKEALDYALTYEGILEYRMGDYPLWNAISQKYKIGYINESTAVYRRLNNSASNQNSLRKQFNFIISNYDVRFFFMNRYHYCDDIIKKVFNNYYTTLLTYGVLLDDKSILKKIDESKFDFEFRHWLFKTLFSSGLLRKIIFWCGSIFTSRVRFSQIMLNVLIKNKYSRFGLKN